MIRRGDGPSKERHSVASQSSGYSPSRHATGAAGTAVRAGAVEDAQLEGTIATPAEALALLRDRFPLP